MKATETVSSNENGGKGFHPLYLWGIFYVLMTYGYPVFWYLTLPKADQTITSEAAYKEMAKAQNGALGDDLPLVFLVIPLVLLLINVILSIRMKNTGRRYFLNTARIIKYLLIPFYIMGAVVIITLILLMFTPVVIMIFVSPIVAFVLSVMGWISMVGSAPMMIAYLSRAKKEGKVGFLFSAVITIMQFFFGADVIGTIICAIREKKIARGR